MIQIPQGVSPMQESDENNVPREGLKVSLKYLLGKHLNIECDSLLLLLKEPGGEYKCLRSRNQDTRLHNIWMGSGFEETRVNSPEFVLKEEADAEEKELHLLTLRPKQRNRSGRTKRNSEWLQNKPRTTKRQKSCDTKNSLPALKDQVYTLVNACDEKPITSFYHFCLKAIKAVPLKKILKAWIKAIEHKKQAVHPYNGGEDTKPDWWPPTTGGHPRNCRHIEPDHSSLNERQILAVWLLRRFDVKLLRDSTQHIALSLEEKCRDKVVHFLENMYAIRKEEQSYENGERDGNSQISLNIPMDELESLMHTGPPKIPVYIYPEIGMRAGQMILAVAQAPFAPPPYDAEQVLSGIPARDSVAMPAGRSYVYNDLGYQQNTASCSNTLPDIGLPGLELAHESISDQKFPQGGPPPSLDLSNLSFCDSMDRFNISSIIEAEQAVPTASAYHGYKIANNSNAAPTSQDALLSVDAARSELQDTNVYPYICGNFLQDGPPGPPPSLTLSNSSFCDSMDHFDASSIIKAEQTVPKTSAYSWYNIANYSNAAPTSKDTLLSVNASRPELQDTNVYPYICGNFLQDGPPGPPPSLTLSNSSCDTIDHFDASSIIEAEQAVTTAPNYRGLLALSDRPNDQVRFAGGPPSRSSTRDESIFNDRLFCTTNEYSQTPEFSIDSSFVASHYSDHSGELVGKEQRWQSRSRDEPSFVPVGTYLNSTGWAL